MRGLIAAIVVAVAAPAPAWAGPETLALGEPARVQEAAELQLVVSSAWAPGPGRAAWAVGGEVEYGLSERWQIAVEGTRFEEPAMDGAPWEVEAGVALAALRRPSWRITVGAGAAVASDGDQLALAAVPSLGLAAERGRWGGNLSFAADLAPSAPGDAEATAALALYAGFGAITPIAELAFDPTDAGAPAWNLGAAVDVGPFELGAGGGRGGEATGWRAGVTLVWEADLGSEPDEVTP